MLTPLFVYVFALSFLFNVIGSYVLHKTFPGEVAIELSGSSQVRTR